MKRLILLAFFILLLFPGGAYAHNDYYDFFDFENYIGNNETLLVPPDAGSYGQWELNNHKGSLGDDGITSAKTEKGTSLCLMRKYATYPGVFYHFKKQEYDITQTLQTKFSIKINGDIPGGYGVFRFRKRTSSTPYNLIVFNDDGLISIFGKPFRQNGITARYEKDRWYDVDVTYDVPSGYCKICITGDDNFSLSYEGCSNYEKELTSISRIMFETIGSDNPDQVETRVYLDNWQVNTLPRMYVTNKPETFEDFRFSEDGTGVSKSWMLTDFLAKDKSSLIYAGVFEENECDGDKAVALCKNTDKSLTLWGSFNNKVTGGAVFETDLKLYNSSSDVVISLGNSASYADAILIEAKTGNVYAFGKYTGQKIFPGKQYRLKIAYDTITNQGHITTNDGKDSIRRDFSSSESFADSISSYKLILKGSMVQGSSSMKAVFDNITLSGCDSIYNSYYDVRDYSESPTELSKDNPSYALFCDADESGGNSYVEYIIDSSKADNGSLTFNLISNTDTKALSVDLKNNTITSLTKDTCSFDKSLSLVLTATVFKDKLYVRVIQKDIPILSFEYTFSDIYSLKSAKLMLDCDETSEVYIKKAIFAKKNEFDISSVLQTGEDEFIVVMSNPVDTNISPSITVNKQLVQYEFADPYTLKISHSQSAGEANITVSNIKDIFGVTVTKSCELNWRDMKDSYTVSKPIFFSFQNGIYRPAKKLLPGDITAMLHVKKSN